MSSAHPEHFPHLLGDVGGTNARFALQLGPGRGFSEARTLACADYPTLADAIEHYLGNVAERPRWCAIGIANPVTGDLVRMTNHHWNFSIRDGDSGNILRHARHGKREPRAHAR